MSIYKNLDSIAKRFIDQGYDSNAAYELAYKECEKLINVT
jgi:hypothetical protein